MKSLLKMGSGVKRSTFLTSCLVFLLDFSHLVIPVAGFALKHSCRISSNVAICAETEPKLGAVPQDVLPTVTGFDLSGNNISRIRSSDFETFKLLVWLDLKGNSIRRVDGGAFALLGSLQRLNLNGNKLGSLPAGLFDGLRNLTELRVSRNQITRVAPGALEPLVGLTFLDISKNPLEGKVEAVFQLPSLRELVLAKNRMSVFRPEELSNTSLKLESLDLSGNPLKSFQITANVLPHLTRLNIIGAFQPAPISWDVQTFLSGVDTLDLSELRLGLGEAAALLRSFNSSLTTLSMNKMSCSLAALVSVSCSIPTVSRLQLRSNRLTSIHPSLFQLCSGVTQVDLRQNLIHSVDEAAFRSMTQLMNLTLSDNKLRSVPAALRNLPTLEELDLSANRIRALTCEDFANLTRLRSLSLHANSISALPDCLFEDLTQLQVLKLQNNSISKLSRTFRLSLQNLRELRLNSNKLVSIGGGDFSGLQALQSLSLHSNQIKKLTNGSFSGLTNLTSLQLQSNKIVAQVLVSAVFTGLINLQRLNLRENCIRYEEEDLLPDPPFRQLALLETLEIPTQHHRLKAELPCNILEGLSNLRAFNCRNSQLLSLPRGVFTHTPRLQRLDISSNDDLGDLPPELFHPIPDLRSLYISRINLRSLDFIKEAKLERLEFLQVRKNAFSVVSKEVVKALPELAYVDFQGNSFTCDCDNTWFLNWVTTNNKTQVFDAYDFKCNYPPKLNREKLLSLDTQSCTVNTDFICFLSTTCATLLLMVASFTHRFLRWELTHAYYFLLALLVDSRYKNQRTPHQYDAFVSYNGHDELWVLRHLLPTLEEEQGWRLCLHHRDFQPGKPLTLHHVKGCASVATKSITRL